MDWVQWHEAYSDPGSKRSQRLAIVRERLRIWLDEAPPGPLTVVSMCAGQGLDLLPVLAEHPRGVDVRARLVEADAANIAVGERTAAGARAGAGVGVAAEVGAEAGVGVGAEAGVGVGVRAGVEAGAGAVVEYLRADAGLAAAYDGIVPADLVLAAGVLGNLEADDSDRTGSGLRGLVQAGRPGDLDQAS